MTHYALNNLLPTFYISADGVLTSSFKSRQSGVKKSVEFDLTGTYDERRENNRGSMRMSRDSRESTSGMSGRLTNSNRSLGLDYSLDGSLDDSELKRHETVYLIYHYLWTIAVNVKIYFLCTLY